MGLCTSRRSEENKPAVRRQRVKLNANIERKLSELKGQYNALVVGVIRGVENKQWVAIDKDMYYYGEWKNGAPHGIGKIYNSKDEELIIAGFYDGNIIRDKCIRIYSNSTMYNGPLNTQMLMEGQGRLENPQFIYEGEFKSDKFDGQGFYEVRAGPGQTRDYYFQGQFSKGHKVRGKQVTASCTYEGEFLNDKKHGKGVLVWREGGKYEGEFQMDMKNGEGKLYDADGRLVRVGKWKHNEMVGRED